MAWLTPGGGIADSPEAGITLTCLDGAGALGKTQLLLGLTHPRSCLGNSACKDQPLHHLEYSRWGMELRTSWPRTRAVCMSSFEILVQQARAILMEKGKEVF